MRDLAAQGLSASQIANHLGGVTRSAVIGQMKRRGIDLKNKRGGRHDTVAELPAPVVAEPETVPTPEPVAEPSPEPVTTLALARGQCKFPINDGVPQWLHCGASALRGPYCNEHRSRMYSQSHKREAV